MILRSILNDFDRFALYGLLQGLLAELGSAAVLVRRRERSSRKGSYRATHGD